MLVQIIRSDNQYDYVQDFMLDKLIESKEIVKFKRSAGWATVGTHPIRKRNRNRKGDCNDKDRTAVNDDTSVREYRRAYSSSLEPF